MARYEYRCKTCGSTFELRRPMAEADAAAPCPVGHADTVRLLSVFAAVGTNGAGAAAPGVPCGAHCACHPA